MSCDITMMALLGICMKHCWARTRFDMICAWQWLELRPWVRDKYLLPYSYYRLLHTYPWARISHTDNHTPALHVHARAQCTHVRIHPYTRAHHIRVLGLCSSLRTPEQFEMLGVRIESPFLLCGCNDVYYEVSIRFRQKKKKWIFLSMFIRQRFSSDDNKWQIMDFR